MQEQKILVVDDDREILFSMAKLLEYEGFRVVKAGDGLEALERLNSEKPDLVILDIMMPKLDGISVLRTMRSRGNRTPVLLLTAKAEIDDKVLGLELGADDYMIKPFEAEELLARIRLRTRQSSITQVNHLKFGNLILNLDTRELSVAEREVKLSNKEFLLMETFLRNSKKIIPKNQLILKVWGPLDESDYNQLEVFISFLRKKLRFLAASAVIKTTKGVGYSLEDGEKEGSS